MRRILRQTLHSTAAAIQDTDLAGVFMAADWGHHQPGA